MAKTILNGYPSFGISAKPSTGDQGSNVIVGRYSIDGKVESGETAICITNDSYATDLGFVIIKSTMELSDGDVIYCIGDDGFTKRIVWTIDGTDKVVSEPIDRITISETCNAKASVSVDIIEESSTNHKVKCYVNFDDMEDTSTLVNIEILFFVSDNGNVTSGTLLDKYSKSAEIKLTNTLPDGYVEAYAFVWYKSGTSLSKKYLGTAKRFTT